MSIVETILSLIKREVRDREVSVPGKEKKGLLMMDAAGNERLIVEAEHQVHNTFEMAAISDMLGFAATIPQRYTDIERYPDFREIYVVVDDQDIPKQLILSDKSDGLRCPVPSANFVLKYHRDFVRWFNQTQNMTQSQFRNLLLQLKDQHDQGDNEETGVPSLAKRLEQLTFKVEINFQDSVETARNRELVYKEQEMVGSVDIPKFIRVNCPVYSGTTYACNVEFEVLIIKPKDEREKIKFSLVPYGQTKEQIVEEAAIWVASEEFIKPIQKIIEGYAVPLAPAYVRKVPSYVSQDMNSFAMRSFKE